MAGIYQRDNLNLQAIIADALNRRERTQQQNAERVNSNVNAISNLVKAGGRWFESYDKDRLEDPSYRAARADYVVTGDRSGLDAYNAALRQAEESAKQRKFQSEESQKQREFQDEMARYNSAIQGREAGRNRMFNLEQSAAQRAFQERQRQAAEEFQSQQNDLNRAIQWAQLNHAKSTDKASMLKNYNDALALKRDIEQNTSKYSSPELELARANNAISQYKQNMLDSGLFTASDFVEETPPSGNLGNWSADKAKIEALIGERKYSEAKKIADAYADSKDTGVAKDLPGIISKINQGFEGARYNKAKQDAASSYDFDQLTLLDALGIGKAGLGGKGKGKVKFTFIDNGKQKTEEAEVVRRTENGVPVADIVIDGITVQKGLPLAF